MSEVKKFYLLRKVLENVVLSAVVFCIWSIYLGAASYFAFGLLVACVFIIIEREHIEPMYIGVFILNVAFFPSAILLNILYGHSETSSDSNL